jgi:beta-glucosidase
MRNLVLLVLLCTTGMVSAAPPQEQGRAHPEIWPAVSNPVRADPVIESRIRDLLARMSLEQKVGQIIQGDLASITPEDVKTYHLGTVFNGGNSAPGGKQFATGAEWLADADRFYAASVTPQGDLPTIPMIWGSDAVHGHNRVTGATLFPHNIGLGAMRDPALMRKIGAVTAKEMRITGLDWTFGPTLAVVRDDRWGRSYESYSENPAVVASYARPLVEGLQGKIGAADWLKGPHIIATAKHFVGDGGTTGGKDQGDNASSEADLRDIQAAGYRPALEAGVQSVMASYSSWQGRKMHGNASLLNGVLKGRMQFGGFVVGDWNAHGQLPGCQTTDCADALLAGLDLYMAPDSWKGLIASTLAGVRSGKIPMARLDEAVTRILRVKLRSGVFEAGKPSSRPFAGQFDALGSPAHRAVARQAVQKSLVLLKNEHGALPLRQGESILVAGDGADSFMKQSGGWTLTWQGTGLTNRDFPGATTIGQGIVAASAGKAVLSADGSYAQKPDVAVVIFGEDPYAEFQGDVPDLLFRDKIDNLALLRRYQAAGIKTVAVFLSGRPLWVNAHINAADAFVAAWLPGSEGGGVADVLFGKTDFKGKLPFSWPRRAMQFSLNIGDKAYDPLFAFGYGLSYARPKAVARLDEASGLPPGADLPLGTWFARGKLGAGTALNLGAGGASVPVTVGTAASGNGWLRSMPIDRTTQEDARRFVWSGAGPASVVLAQASPLDLSRETNGAVAVEIDLRVDAIGGGSVAAIVYSQDTKDGFETEIGEQLRAIVGKGWQTLSIPLSCFAGKGADMARLDVPFSLKTSTGLDLAISRLALGTSGAGRIACGKS